MGNIAQGWQLRQGPGGTWYVRFSYGGKRRQFTTGTRDYGEATKKAAERYAEVVSGKRAARNISASLAHLCGEWLAEYKKDHHEKTAKVVEYMVSGAWLPFFASVDRITPQGVKDYFRHRLTKVTRVTARKEVSALRQFIDWAELECDVPRMKRHGFSGKRSGKARKEKHEALPAALIQKVIDKMPEFSPRGGVPLRYFFQLLWETGLRESILFRLRAPKHYSHGKAELFITRDINKAHVECSLPLTKPARDALDALTLEIEDGEAICPRFNLREPLAKACAAAGVPRLSPYDFRHSRLSNLAEGGGPLTGVQYLALHGSLSTTAKYVHPRKGAAEEVLFKEEE